MKKSLVAGIALIVIGAVLWLGKRPYQHWKEGHYLGKAEEYAAKGDLRNAAICAKNTLEVNPSNLAASRVMADVTEKAHAPEAVFWRQRIVQLQPDVLQNRLDLARAALSSGNVQEAGAALSSVPESGRNRADFHELAAGFEAARKNYSGADAQLKAAAQLDPTNKALQMNIAMLEVESNDHQTSEAAKKKLQQFSADPALRRDALRQLAKAAMRDTDYPKAQSYSSQLVQTQPVAFQDQLLNLSILKDTKSKVFPATLDYVERNVATNTSEITGLSDWMVAQKMQDQSLQWLLKLPEQTRRTPQILLATADCYAADQNWPKVQSLLTDEHWKEMDYLRLAVLARAARGLKNDLAAQADWRTAVTSADGRPQALGGLVRLANSWGWPKEQEEAAWPLIEKFPNERWAAELLNRDYITNGNTAGLQKVYATLLKANGSDVAIRNNFAAVSLLLHTQLPQAEKIAQEDYQHYPDAPAIVSTYAFSLYLQGKTQEGLAVLEKLPKDALHSPGISTYYGTLLAAAGQPVKAREYLDISAKSSLLPEERALVAAARAASPNHVK